MSLFNLGKTVATPAALETLGRAEQSPGEFLVKHARGEWGDLSDHDAEANQPVIAF